MSSVISAPTPPPLSQAVGYGIVVGVGALFAVSMIFITRVLSKYLHEEQDSEMYSTANRSVKMGLISSAVVSSWTWPATLLTSATFAYSWGVSGSLWYGIGGSVQIFLFTILALEIKRRAPRAHTVVEIIHVRYGKYGHFVYLFYSIATNVLVTSMLLLGGAGAVSALTGMHIVAANMLLPTGVLVYTTFGGIKSTFITDWIHTVIIFIILLFTMFSVYATSDLIGSPGRMWELLNEVSLTMPSTGEGGSYVTMHNPTALLTGVVIMMGGFSVVFGDPSYAQKAIAASPYSAMGGYITGGLFWMIIPWALGTSGGLAALALTNNPAFPTYPNPMSPYEIGQGLAVPYALTALHGKGGAAAALLMTFMAVTSASSAELIACSSILTYDVYRTYINPRASGKQLVRVSHICVIGFGIFMGAFATMFTYIGVTIGWMMTFIGIILCPPVFALAGTLFTSRMNKLAMIFGPPLGMITGLASWLGSAAAFNNGVINTTTLTGIYPTLIGNCCSLFSPVLYMTILSFIQPTEFNWDILRRGVELGDDATDEQVRLVETEDTLEERANLKKASRFAIILGGGIVLCIVVLWPMPMYGSRYIFSKQFFTGWVVVEFIWLWIAAIFITFFPLWESRSTFIRLWKLMTGQSKLSVVDSVTRERKGKVDNDKEKKLDSDTVVEEDQYRTV